MEIQSWQVNIPEDMNDKIYDYFIDNISVVFFKTTKLLNTNQDSFDLLEKYVYDVAMYHFQRLNIEYNNSYYIEFWYKNNVKLNNYHFDCDEYERKTNNNFIYPLLSNIIYLTDSKYPTLITNIDLEKYKYKEFKKETEITLVFPKKNKHITFDGSKMHGLSAIFSEDKPDENRYLIAINLWDKKPTNVDYYVSQKIEDKIYNSKKQLVSISPESKIENKILVEKMLTFNFFEDLLYKNLPACAVFSELIEKDFQKNSNNIFKIEEKKEDDNSESKERDKIMSDIENIKTIDNIVYNNRFLQRFVLNNIYSKDTCNWIINESELYANENGGWSTNRHKNYPTTDIPVENIKPIFKFVLSTIQNIMSKIYRSYCIPEIATMNIVDLFVVKYDEKLQTKLDFHTDVSFITFSIMLSSSKDYEGGGTKFNDGITVVLEQGDILLHSGYVKHSGLEITKGKRYILVGFTSININDNNY
jgi:hypothetical protein